jgi:hypothetical protein
MGGVTLAGGNVDIFTVALDPDTINEEIVYVTQVSGDTLTISRGQAGTGTPGVSGIAHTSGAAIKHVLTSDDLIFFRNNASPVASFAFSGSTSGTTTVQATAVAGTNTLTLPATSNDTLVGKATTDTLTNKTLTSPVIGTISNTGTLTLPTSTDTLVGRATTDTLTNKTLTTPVIASISNSGTITVPTGTGTLALTSGVINNSLLTTAGDTIYRNATVPARLGIGTAGQVLTVNSGATAPEWTTVSTSPIFVGCLAKCSTSIAFTAGTPRTIPFATADVFDTNGFHDPATNNTRITIPTGKSGYYLITGSFFFYSGIEYQIMRFIKNGTGGETLQTMKNLASNNASMTGSFTAYLTAGDYIEMTGQINSTTTDTLDAQFGVAYLGA